MKQQSSDWKKKSESLKDQSLDELLASPAQISMKSLVDSLPEETVSLQWRSMLNERVRSLAPIKRRISVWLVGARALAGAGVVALISIALVVNHGAKKTIEPSSVDANAFATALVSAHRDSVISSEIAGPGIADEDVERSGDSNAEVSGDTDSDAL